MKKLFLAILVTFVLIPAISQAEGKSTVDAFMKDYLKIKANSYSQSPKFNKYFTKNLRDNFRTAAKNEDLSIKTTPADEKPCIPDSDIFFAVAEGADNYEIASVTSNSVTVNLKSSAGDSNKTYDYSAEFLMKKSGEKYYIDNIITILADGSKVDLIESLKNSDCQNVQP